MRSWVGEFSTGEMGNFQPALTQERFLVLLEDADFEAAITYGTGDPKKVRLRFSKIEEIIRETLQ